MFFDTSLVYEIQNMVFQIQRMAIGGMVVIMAFSLLRMLLWSLFSLNMATFSPACPRTWSPERWPRRCSFNPAFATPR